jgi:hypothetical protein
MFHSSSGLACPVLAVFVSSWLSAVAQEPTPPAPAAFPAKPAEPALDRRGIAERLGAPAELPDVLSTVPAAERQRQLRRAELIPAGDRERLLRGAGSDRARLACAFVVLGDIPTTVVDYRRDLLACAVLKVAAQLNTVRDSLADRAADAFAESQQRLQLRQRHAAAAILCHDGASPEDVSAALQAVATELTPADRSAADAWLLAQLPQIAEPRLLARGFQTVLARGDLTGARAVFDRFRTVGEPEKVFEFGRLLAAAERVAAGRREGDSDAIHALRLLQVVDHPEAIVESQRLYSARERHALPATLLGFHAFFDGRRAEAETWLHEALSQPGQDETTRFLQFFVRWVPKLIAGTVDAEAVARDSDDLVAGPDAEAVTLTKTLRAMGWPRLSREAIGDAIELTTVTARELPGSLDAQQLLCGAAMLTPEPAAALDALAEPPAPVLRALPELAWARAAIAAEAALRTGAAELPKEVDAVLRDLEAAADGAREAAWLRSAYQWSLAARPELPAEARRQALASALAGLVADGRGGGDRRGFAVTSARIVARCAQHADGDREPDLADFQQLSLGDEAEEADTYVPALCALARCGVDDALTLLEELTVPVHRPRLAFVRQATLAEVYAGAGRRDVARKAAEAALVLFAELRDDVKLPGIVRLGSFRPGLLFQGRLRVQAKVTTDLLVLPAVPDLVRLRQLARYD